MSRDNRRFQKGSGLFTCICCGKRTRDTGHDGALNSVCEYCHEVGGWGNMLSDNCCTQEEYDKAIAQLREQFNRDENDKEIKK